jgi:hypothetical protein
MKKVKRKFMRLSKRGESLAESLASLFVMTLMLVAVAAMIDGAVKIAVRATGDASARQENTINNLMLGNFSEVNPDNVSIAQVMFEFTVPGDPLPKTAEHQVTVFDSVEDNVVRIIAFAPQ